MADNSHPWESGTSGKYQYHPGGDRTRAPRDAPSALHSVIVPEVNLPKVRTCAICPCLEYTSDVGRPRRIAQAGRLERSLEASDVL